MSDEPFMTLDQAEEILAAHEAGVFKVVSSELERAKLVFDRAYNDAPEDAISDEEIERLVKRATED